MSNCSRKATSVRGARVHVTELSASKEMQRVAQEENCIPEQTVFQWRKLVFHVNPVFTLPDVFSRQDKKIYSAAVSFESIVYPCWCTTHAHVCWCFRCCFLSRSCTRSCTGGTAPSHPEAVVCGYCQGSQSQASLQLMRVLLQPEHRECWENLLAKSWWKLLLVEKTSNWTRSRHHWMERNMWTKKQITNSSPAQSPEEEWRLRLSAMLPASPLSDDASDCRRQSEFFWSMPSR